MKNTWQRLCNRFLQNNGDVHIYSTHRTVYQIRNTNVYARTLCQMNDPRFA